jgi:uncharacterized membrane protein YeaQ/YmgE (transglycosylase-associated protein family)
LFTGAVLWGAYGVLRGAPSIILWNAVAAGPRRDGALILKAAESAFVLSFQRGTSKFPRAFTRYSEERGMAVETLLIWILVGAVAGWLAGLVVRGFGFGLIGNIIVGIVGAFLGGWLFGTLGIAIGVGIINTIFTAFIGAVVLLLIVRVLKRA